MRRNRGRGTKSRKLLLTSEPKLNVKLKKRRRALNVKRKKQRPARRKRKSKEIKKRRNAKLRTSCSLD